MIITTKPHVGERVCSWSPLLWVRHLLRSRGLPYMSRYSVLKQRPSGQNEWRIYLHQFLSGDDAGHHNHPFRYSLSLVLWGSYTEEILRPEGDITTRRVRWCNWINAERYHRIVSLHPGPGAKSVWTLFMAGPLARKPDGTLKGWGFWVVGRGHVSHLEYNNTHNKGTNQ